MEDNFQYQPRTEPFEYSKRIVHQKDIPVCTIQQENKNRDTSSNGKGTKPLQAGKLITNNMVSSDVEGFRSR